jgi:peptidoglycan-N-acetylglucosamine deacetylase
MRAAGRITRGHFAAAAAAAGAIGLALVSPVLAALPLGAFVALCLAAPFFPSWQLFLPVVTHGDRARRAVALTFDDGPEPRVARPLLALLAREGAPATFFVVGHRAVTHPEVVDAILAAGHDVANHSFHHDPFLMLRGGKRLRSDIARWDDALARHAIASAVFRPPAGITNPQLGAALAERGLACVAFSCRPLDFANRRVAGLARRVLATVRGGDVILLHDVIPARVSPEALLAEVEAILAGLRARGFAVVPLTDLLGIPVMRRLDRAAFAPVVAARTSGIGPSGAGLASALQGVLLLAFPVLVFAGVSRLGPRLTAVVMSTLLVPALVRGLRRRARASLAVPLSAGVLLAAAATLDDARFMLAYPSLVNGVLLWVFALSLVGEQPIVERFARLQVSDLSDGERRYCRSVTLVWCVFFVLNGTVAMILALRAPHAWWAAYTGGVSYVLVGVLFAAEYLVRKARFGRFNQGPIDRLVMAVLRRSPG